MQNPLTDRKQRYEAAPRALNDPTFPPTGFYFIRGVKEKKDANGNSYPYASVNWKLNEDDVWDDFEPNRFIIRLDYIFGDFSLKPKVSPFELKHQVINIKSIVVDQKQHILLTNSRIYADWEITGFTDMFDAMPYFNLFNPIVFAAEDEQYELQELNYQAIEEEKASDILDEDILEYDDENEPNDNN